MIPSILFRVSSNEEHPEISRLQKVVSSFQLHSFGNERAKQHKRAMLFRYAPLLMRLSENLDEICVFLVGIYAWYAQVGVVIAILMCLIVFVVVSCGRDLFERSKVAPPAIQWVETHFDQYEGNIPLAVRLLVKSIRIDFCDVAFMVEDLRLRGESVECLLKMVYGEAFLYLRAWNKAGARE